MDVSDIFKDPSWFGALITALFIGIARGLAWWFRRNDEGGEDDVPRLRRTKRTRGDLDALVERVDRLCALVEKRCLEEKPPRAVTPSTRLSAAERAERDRKIKLLARRKCERDEIAEVLGVSKSTVTRVLRVAA